MWTVSRPVTILVLVASCRCRCLAAGGAFFAALEVPSAVREAMIPVRDRILRAVPDLEPSPVAGLHVTLAYAGSMTAMEQGLLVERLGDVARSTPPFCLVYRGLGTFPFRREGLPRVLWAGCTAGRRSLDALAARVTEAVRSVSGRQDDFAFSPHVTLARAQTPEQGARLARALAGEPRAVTYGGHRVGAFLLLRSGAPSPPGEYAVVARFVLGSGAGASRKESKEVPSAPSP